MITLDDTNANELQTRSLSVIEEAKMFTVETDEDAERLGEFLRLKVKAIIKEANDCFDPLIKSANDHTRSIRESKKRIVEPLRVAESTAKAMLGSYFSRKEQERRQALEKAAAEARRKAEDEAIRLAAELEEHGDHEAAQATIEREPAPVAVVKPVEAPKVTGVSVRKSWDYEIVNPAMIKPSFMTPNAAMIGKTVRAMGPDAETVIGGIVVTEKTTVASRSR